MVNNNAAATLLILAALARDRGVLVSRGELVEIGGSYRVPEIMRESGARLVEVGTTNRTHPRDYAGAIDDDTAMILKVHTSNYRVVGFTAEVSIAELVEIGRERDVPVVYDLGSGCLADLDGKGSEQALRRRNGPRARWRPAPTWSASAATSSSAARRPESSPAARQRSSSASATRSSAPCAPAGSSTPRSRRPCGSISAATSTRSPTFPLCDDSLSTPRACAPTPCAGPGSWRISQGSGWRRSPAPRRPAAARCPRRNCRAGASQ